MRADLNQTSIVMGLRAIGCTVTVLSQVGGSCPDLLVGYRSVNYLLEVKSGNNKLSPGQREFHANWRGRINVVRTVDEAIQVVTR